MALITEQIPEQNFEVIRQAIGSILATELIGQTYYTGLGLSASNIWDERNISFDISELPAINVGYESADYDQHDVRDRRSTNKYNIDVHVAEKHTDADSGDELAAIKAQRLSGIIMYILSHPSYTNLGFTPGTISTGRVISNAVAVMQQGDSNHNRVSRVVFEVITYETTSDIPGLSIESIHTTAKLDETDKGFHYVVPTS